MRCLNIVDKSLKKAFKERQTERINYYEAILDPTEFGRSVENMFYMSFLIKDGGYGLEVDNETGLPDIGKWA